MRERDSPASWHQRRGEIVADTADEELRIEAGREMMNPAYGLDDGLVGVERNYQMGMRGVNPSSETEEPTRRASDLNRTWPSLSPCRLSMVTPSLEVEGYAEYRRETWTLEQRS